jgi:hypothetical protein
MINHESLKSLVTAAGFPLSLRAINGGSPLMTVSKGGDQLKLFSFNAKSGGQRR